MRPRSVKTWKTATEYGVGGTPTIYVNGVSVRGLSRSAILNAVKRALKN